MTPSTQTGYGFELGNRDIVKFKDMPVAKPKAGEVLLKIEAAGLCLTDIHILQAQQPLGPDKFVMGHETAGQIAEVGEGLDSEKYYPGARFAISTVNSCGVCTNCRLGKDNTCDWAGLGGSAYGVSIDGGFQDYMLVKNLRTLVPIPDGVSYEQAAVASDAVLTPYHAINKVKADLTPLTKVLVTGLGGLGLNAIQIIKNFGSHVVASDIKPEAEAAAREAGADEFYVDVGKSNHQLEAFDVCLDFAGVQGSVDTCQAYVKLQGKLVIVGMGQMKLLLQNYDLARREVTVYYNIGGTGLEQKHCMEWIAKGLIKPKITVVHLDKIGEYLQKLEDGKVSGRVVFTHAK